MDIQAVPCSLLVTIVDRGQGDKLALALAEQGAAFNLVMAGRGTAKRKMLSYLGLGDTEKDILLTRIAAPEVRRTMACLAERLQLAKPGRGVSFIIPLSGMQDSCQAAFTEQKAQGQGGITMQTVSHSLIFSVMNHGYADDVMDTAREAGAPGGTVMRAHGAGYKHAEKFLGITILPDKDVLLILAPERVCPAIMNAIVSGHGGEHEARAIAFSLPVCDIVGLASLD